jgi:hypothetical protein
MYVHSYLRLFSMNESAVNLELHEIRYCHIEIV